MHVSLLNRDVEMLEMAMNAENPDKTAISRYLKRIEQKYATVEEDSKNYMNKLEGENEELEIELYEMDKLLNTISDMKFNAEFILGEAEKTPPTPPAGIAGNQTTDVTLDLMARLQADVSAASRERRSLLPSIQLPKFDGNIEKYEEFIESYEAIIQNHPGIEDVEKFIFLKNHLQPRSPAADLLAGFATTSA